MARGVLSPEVRRKRQLEQFAKLMSKADAALGNSTGEVTVEQLEEIQVKKGLPDDLALEAEAVLLYYESNGVGFTKQTCPACKREFAYKYTIKGGQFRCSNECRAAELAKIGIQWNYHKTPEARWGGEMPKGVLPLIVPPQALPLVDAALAERRNHEKEPPEQNDQEKLG